MFRQELEKIDFFKQTQNNLHKLYERYQTGISDDLTRRDSIASDRKTNLDEQQKSERRRFTQEQYRNQLEDMLEINQTLSE